MKYQYIIVGAGPTGLTLAWYLQKLGQPILIIDRMHEIGGCHRVQRVNGRFSEHGPRIYLDNYHSLKDILQEMSISWNDMFVPYDFSYNTSSKELIRRMTGRELMIFVKQFISFTINDSRSRVQTMREFADTNKFTPSIIQYIDMMCRLSDGGTIDRFTVFEFFSLFNQNYFYSIYQPRVPNDRGLFKVWRERMGSNVHFMLGEEVTGVNTNASSISLTLKTGETIDGYNVLFTLPPQPMYRTITQSINAQMVDRNLMGCYNQWTQFVRASRYHRYISSTYHWNKWIDLPKVWGTRATDWGIVFVVLSNYMDLTGDKSKTIISVAIKNTDRVSTVTNKTADQSTESQLLSETFRQLKESYPNLPDPDQSVIDPNLYHSTNQWISHDDSFFLSTSGYWPSRTTNSRIHWIGSHNGTSTHHYTSMESAMGSAVHWLNGNINQYINYPISVRGPLTVSTVLILVLIILLAVCIYFTKNYIMQ